MVALGHLHHLNLALSILDCSRVGLLNVVKVRFRMLNESLEGMTEHRPTQCSVGASYAYVVCVATLPVEKAQAHTGVALRQTWSFANILLTNSVASSRV